MADAITFRNALTRCGITQAEALDAIPDQGYTDMLEFAQLSPVGIESFVKSVNKLPAVPPDDRPSIPFASVKKLKAMRWWTVEKLRCGLAVVHNQFTVAELTRVLARLDYEAHLAINKPDVPELTEKFVSFGTKWRVFSERFKGHCEAQRGCMNIPLAYVLREHTEVDDDMRNADYEDSDSRLMNIVVLQGDEYRQDNIRVWNLLRPLVYGTAAWDYVKNFDRQKDGRAAFRTLERRGEGDAAIDARRTKAEQTIAKAQYTGTSKRFTLQNYINLLQGAFTELLECGDPYTERKKVDVFVKGLVANRFAVTKQAIIQSPTTREDFQAAYAFVETMEQYNTSGITAKNDGFDRHISSVGKKGKLETGYRSPKDWNKLSKEERMKIIEARGTKGSNKPKKGGASDSSNEQQYKRKLAELAAEVLHAENGDETINESTGGAQTQTGGDKKQKADGNPANQFGRHAHSVLVRFAEEVMRDDKKKSGKS
jgi:hypothetical protein